MPVESDGNLSPIFQKHYEIIVSMWMTDKWTVGSEKPLQLQGGPYGPPCTVRTPIVAALDE